MFSISCSSERTTKERAKKHTKLCNEMLKFNVWLTNKKRRNRKKSNTEKCTKKMENHGKVFFF